ncbi:hypothetical protein RIF29_16107 [Crotalaria pallida]|uniref:Uncharacterized protein n=1 Tax=Crotalaria pallida TaxID=3830 RepID=A0AAN9FGM8_CROPI
MAPAPPHPLKPRKNLSHQPISHHNTSKHSNIYKSQISKKRRGKGERIQSPAQPQTTAVAAPKATAAPPRLHHCYFAVISQPPPFRSLKTPQENQHHRESSLNRRSPCFRSTVESLANAQAKPRDPHLG